MTADDLVRRLSAGLDRDEQLARAAGGADWLVTKVPYEGIQLWVGEDDPLGRTDWQTAHIAEQDPARILDRYVPAIRKVIAKRDRALAELDQGQLSEMQQAIIGSRLMAYAEVIEDLASIYPGEATKDAGVRFSDFPIRTNESMEPGQIGFIEPRVEYRPQRRGSNP